MGSPTDESVMPSRLLEIQPVHNTVRLVEVKEAQRYALLSYCWGGDQGTKTTKSNLASHRHGVGINGLSQSIRDAVQVARLLQIKHLWVDALCIVQDDPTDLIQELGKMARIYQNGTLTILAGGTASAQTRFLQPRERPDHRYKLKIRLPCGKVVHILLDHHQEAYSENLCVLDTSDPVTSRGWIFQEISLSQHLLYFSASQLTFFSPRGVYTDGGMPFHGFRYKSPQFGPLFLGQTREDKIKRSFDHWLQIIDTYCKMKITESDDKLPAISAVAQEFGIAFLNTIEGPVSYKAGLWAQHMPLNLLWGNDSSGTIEPRPPYRAPTWSWASVGDHVITSRYELVNSRHPARYNANILQCDVGLVSDFGPYGRVLGGTLKIEGMIKDIPEYTIEAQCAVLLDPAYHMGPFYAANDVLEANMSLSSKSLTKSEVALMLIIRMPETEAEMDDERSGRDANNGFSSLILRKQDGPEVHSRLGVLHAFVPDPLAENVQNWQASFQRKSVTIL
jgi:hypothetical protein